MENLRLKLDEISIVAFDLDDGSTINLRNTHSSLN